MIYKIAVNKDEIDRRTLRLKDKNKRYRISRYCKEIDKIFNVERVDKSSLLYDLLNTEPYSIWALDVMYSNASMTKMCELFKDNYNGSTSLFQDISCKKTADLPKQINRLIELFGNIYCEIGFFERDFKTNDLLSHIRNMNSGLLSDFNHYNDQLYRKLYDYLYYSESEDGDRFVDWIEKLHKTSILDSRKILYWYFHRYTTLYLKDLIDNLETLTYSDKQTSMCIFEKIMLLWGKVDNRTDGDKMEASND